MHKKHTTYRHRHASDPLPTTGGKLPPLDDSAFVDPKPAGEAPPMLPQIRDEDVRVLFFSPDRSRLMYGCASTPAVVPGTLRPARLVAACCLATAAALAWVFLKAVK